MVYRGSEFAFCLIATKPLQGYDSDEGHIFQW